MTGKTILIVGQHPDPHIEAVCEHLHEWGHKTVLFDCFQTDHFLTLRVDERGFGGEVSVGDQATDFDAIDAVWWRWKPFSAAEWSGAFAQAAEEFASREWRATLRSLQWYLPRAEWINPLGRHFDASFKPYQMTLAKNLGFRTPETLFTNDNDAVQDLCRSHERVIYKTVSSFLIPPDEIIYTNEIDPAELEQSAPEIQRAPGTFQEYIEKDHELRVTMVGNEMFAIRINSQECAETSIDWRHSQFRDMYEQVELDASLFRSLVRLHQDLGLRFGAYDFVVPPDDEPVFLEVNPGGQWLWLEHKLDLPISQAVARVLIEPASTCQEAYTPPAAKSVRGPSRPPN